MQQSDLPRILAEQRAAADALPDPGARLGLFDWTTEEVILRTTLPPTCGECAFCFDDYGHVADCRYAQPGPDPMAPYPVVIHWDAPPETCPIRRHQK